MEKEKRTAKTYYFDKDLYKKVAHQAIDDECDIATILEAAIQKLHDKVSKEGISLDKYISSNQYAKTIRLYPRYVLLLENMSKKTGIACGNILNISIASYYQEL